MRPLFLLSFLGALACSAGGSGDPTTCVPGEQRACSCPGGLYGAQICADSGDRFGACFGCITGDSTGAQEDSGEPGTTAGPGGSSGGSGGGSSGEVEDSSGGPSSSGPGSSGEAETGVSPEPPPPAPDEYDVVLQVASEHPDWLLNSCVDAGGNNEFLFEVVRRLRQKDERWGLNWKRGVIGDMSQDVVDYHYGDGPHEESTEVNIIDVIVGHCGDDPQAGWLDVTQATLDANTVGMWTLAGQDL